MDKNKMPQKLIKIMAKNSQCIQNNDFTIANTSLKDKQIKTQSIPIRLPIDFFTDLLTSCLGSDELVITKDAKQIELFFEKLLKKITAFFGCEKSFIYLNENTRSLSGFYILKSKLEYEFCHLNNSSNNYQILKEIEFDYIPWESKKLVNETYSQNSIFYVPINVDKHLFGYVGISLGNLNLRFSKQEYLSVLTFISQFFSNYFEKFFLQLKLKKEKEFLKKTINAMTEAFIRVNEFGQIIDFNKSCLDLFEKESSDFENAYLYKSINIVPQNRSKDFTEFFIEKLHQKEAKFEEDFLLLSDKNRSKIIKGKFHALENDLNCFDGYMVLFYDLTEKFLYEQEMEFFTFRDSITGLYNRAYFQRKFSEIKLEENMPISVIVGDIDDLKHINDSFGYDSGDEVLILVSGILETVCNPQDILARIGGDEFAILCPNKNVEESQLLILKLKEKLLESKGKISFIPSMSFGFHCVSKEEETLDIALKEAENYMYKNKEHSNKINK